MKETRSSCSSMRKPRITVGCVSFNPEDSPEPVVAISCSSAREAENTARVLLSAQNGVKPFPSGPDIYAGDTNIKVGLIRTGKTEALCQIVAFADPRHLTCFFYAAWRIPWEIAEPFIDLTELLGHYTLTVAHGDRLLLHSMNLVKYVIDKRGV